MIKTQIQLEDWQYDSLKKTGAEAGRSLSDVIRESVSLFLQGKKKGGSVSLDSMDDLKPHDRAWAEAIR
jgi:hypothetical protein